MNLFPALTVLSFVLTGSAAFAAATVDLPGDRYEVIVDGDSTNIIPAALEWEATVPVHLKVREGTCEGIVPGVICVHIVQWADWEQGENTLGLTRREHDGAVIALRTEAEPGEAVNWTAVAAHELGHAMGLHHSVSGTLMSPYQTHAAQTVQPDDVAQWHQIRSLLR